MTGPGVVVRKNRDMIAAEIAQRVGANEWERAHLQRLRVPTLKRLARALDPEFESHPRVSIDTL